MPSQVAKCILFLLAMFLPVGLIGQTPPLDLTNTLTIEAQDSIIYGTAQCCGHQGATGSSISSSAGWSTGYNGAFFNSNGTGRGDTGAQLNPTIPSWRMALGSGDQEWPGAGDQFTIGRVDPGGNYLHPNILFTINNAGRVNVPGQSSFLFGTVVCCGQGPTGSSIGSSAGWSGAYNGTFFNSNGTSDGGGAGGQINTSLPSWRMALGNGGQEWPGGDNFAIGRVAPGANFTTPNVFFIVDNAGKLHTSGGIVFPDGSLGARAQARGPRGPQGPTGAQGPQGPPGAPLFAVCTNESPFPVSCFNSCNNVVVSKVISAGQTCAADGVSNACGAVTNGGTGIPTTYGMCCTCK